MNTMALKVSKLSIWQETKTGRRQFVDNISFTINAGQTTGLVGESGCGKSMTAMAIMGLLTAPGIQVESTSIELGGTDISGLSVKQRRKILGRDIAMIFQQPGTALDPVFTVGQQIAEVYRRHQGGSPVQIRQTMLDALQAVGFSQAEEIANNYPHQLSGGMQQLVMIAMAMICRPSILIADEPTTALDSMTQALILRQLKELQARHQTAILLISHDLNVVKHSCDDIIVMYCGRLLEKADCKDLFSHPRHPYSAGLLSCIPEIGPQRPAQINAIPGQVPAAHELPPGCHFAPRCTRVALHCRHTPPDLESDNGTEVACFRPM